MKIKWRKRLSKIGWNTAYNLSSSTFSILFSALIIRLFSKELWGEVVQFLLWGGLLAHLAYWGNKEYLLRQFSLTPSAINQNWQKIFVARLVPLLLTILIIFILPFTNDRKILLGFYLVARFIYLSFDVLILYERKFSQFLLIEWGGNILILLLLLPPYLHSNLDSDYIIIAILMAEFLKCFLGGIYFRNFIRHINISAVSINLLKLSLPFLLLGLTGLLQSRIDQFCLSITMPKEILGTYNVIMNFALVIQSSSAFILAPFIKNLYRLRTNQILQFSFKFFIAGLFIILPAVFILKLIITLVYHLQIGYFSLFLIYIFILPIFAYLPVIYLIIKHQKQNWVLGINIAGILAGGILNLLLTNYFIDKINASLLATAITQWLLLFLFLYVSFYHFIKIRYANPA
jgi:O-antigen/teichoic acid export membrane protein